MLTHENNKKWPIYIYTLEPYAQVNNERGK